MVGFLPVHSIAQHNSFTLSASVIMKFYSYLCGISLQFLLFSLSKSKYAI